MSSSRRRFVDELLGADALLTAREVAELLRVSPETVLRYWRAGELPGFRLRTNVLRFAREDVDRFLMARRRGVISEPACGLSEDAVRSCALAPELEEPR